MHLRSSVKGNAGSLYVFDTQHRFVYANQALLTMWGMRCEDACGKTCLELGNESWHVAMHDEEIECVIATGKPVRGEVPFLCTTKGLPVTTTSSSSSYLSPMASSK